MKVIRRLYRYVIPYRAWALLAFVSMFIVAATTGALIVLVRPLFDDVLSREGRTVTRQQDDREAAAIRLLLRQDRPDQQRGGIVNWMARQRARAQAWWAAHQSDRWKYIL